MIHLKVFLYIKKKLSRKRTTKTDKWSDSRECEIHFHIFCKYMYFFKYIFSSTPLKIRESPHWQPPNTSHYLPRARKTKTTILITEIENNCGISTGQISETFPPWAIYWGCGHYHWIWGRYLPTSYLPLEYRNVGVAKKYFWPFYTYLNFFLFISCVIKFVCGFFLILMIFIVYTAKPENDLFTLVNQFDYLEMLFFSLDCRMIFSVINIRGIARGGVNSYSKWNLSIGN